MVALMSTVINLARPKFCKGQNVEFIGGLGTIIQCYRNSGHWSYLVEMEMGLEPDMGGLVTKLLFYLKTTLFLVRFNIDITFFSKNLEEY